MARVECTAEQGREWQELHGDGYRTGRGDARSGAGPRVDILPVPAEVPGETGAEYVARHVKDAWRIGYTRGWNFEKARPVATA